MNDPILPNLSVQQLEYLVAAAREPTFARAAQTVGVSPSALSQGIAELERRIGMPLFEAAGRNRVLMDQAEGVLRYAERVLSETGELARWVAQLRSGHTGALRVGMIDVAAVDHFSDTLRDFRRERPDVELRLTVAGSGVLIEQLVRGALDLVVCVAPGDRSGLEVTTLLEEPLAIYAPPEARVGRPGTWGPWVTFPQGSSTRAIAADALRTAGAPFEVIAESHQPEVLAAMVRLGVGWTVLPVLQAERGGDPLVPACSGELARRSIAAVRRTGSALFPSADALLAMLVTSGRLNNESPRSRALMSGSDGTRTRDLRRDRPAL